LDWKRPEVFQKKKKNQRRERTECSKRDKEKFKKSPRGKGGGHGGVKMTRTIQNSDVKMFQKIQFQRVLTQKRGVPPLLGACPRNSSREILEYYVIKHVKRATKYKQKILVKVEKQRGSLISST